MNRISIIALASLAAAVAMVASPAHASLVGGEGTPGYAHETQVSSVALSRAQVRAEAAEALRLGLVPGGEQSVVYSAPQLAAIKAAGVDAVRLVVASQR